MKSTPHRKGNPYLLATMILLSFCFSLPAMSQWSTPDASGNIHNTNTGNVGIGITSPIYPLHVNGLSYMQGGLYSIAPAVGGLSGRFMGATNGSANLVVQGNAGNGEAYWISGSNGLLKIGANGGTEPAAGAININDQGSVGIGTTTPAAPLEVQVGQLGTTSGNTYEMARIDGYTANNSQIRFLLNRYTGGNGWTTASTRIQSWTDATPQAYIDFNPNNGLAGIAFGSGSNEQMRITQQGNVLIGKTSQSNTGYILDVNGNGRLNQVVVNTTGADFVFDPAYHLPSLPELQKYIQANHHLPDIAPAAEMQQKGVDLGDNQTRLLQKIEELTLYLIRQDKEIKALKEQNRHLEERNQALESIEQRLSRLEKSLK